MSELIPYLSQCIGLTGHEIIQALRTAPRRYRSFYAKSGTAYRLVSAPPDDLKAMQKALAKFLRPRVSIHPAATAYKQGSSIRDNALAHAGNSALRSLDFEKFFPSLVADDWVDYCRRYPIFAWRGDVELSVQVLFKDEGRGLPLSLALGTSTSPLLANVLMYDFDVFVADHASRLGITYTRYADDLTFSAPETSQLALVDAIVEVALADFGCRNLRINPTKTKNAALPAEMAVTGLVVGNGRVGIGAERKAKVFAQVEASMAGALDAKQMVSLRGLLAFVHGAEPEFLDVLADRYGSGPIARIQKYQPKAD